MLGAGHTQPHSAACSCRRGVACLPVFCARMSRCVRSPLYPAPQPTPHASIRPPPLVSLGQEFGYLMCALLCLMHLGVQVGGWGAVGRALPHDGGAGSTSPRGGCCCCPADLLLNHLLCTDVRAIWSYVGPALWPPGGVRVLCACGRDVPAAQHQHRLQLWPRAQRSLRQHLCPAGPPKSEAVSALC